MCLGVTRPFKTHNPQLAKTGQFGKNGLAKTTTTKTGLKGTFILQSRNNDHSYIFGAISYILNRYRMSLYVGIFLVQFRLAISLINNSRAMLQYRKLFLSSGDIIPNWYDFWWHYPELIWFLAISFRADILRTLGYVVKRCQKSILHHMAPSRG